MAEASDQNQDSGTKSEFSIADCSICLEQLRKPKSLPCLHTFCQDCLSTFITSHDNPGATQVFFNCPVCRRKTLPIEPSSASDLWASQFPTNNFVMEIMKQINPDEKNTQICQPCFKHRNTETPASSWCQDCGHFMCGECNQCHDRVFVHKIISIDQLSQQSAVLMPVQSHCEKHGKNIELICLDHELLCCHICIAIDHRKCDNVSTVIEYADSLKSEEKLTELAKDIDKNVTNIDCVIAEFREKLDAVTTDKDTALQKLSDVRKWFDSQMSKMSEEVMKTYKAETEKLQKTLEDMETVRLSLLQTKAMSNTTQQTGQEHQLVSTVLKGKSEMERCEQIFTNKQDENIRIDLKFRDEFEKMTKEEHDIGIVEVRKQMTEFGITQKSKPLFGRTVKQVRLISLPGSVSNIRGILVTSTGHLVVTGFASKKVLCITESGVLLSTLEFDSEPWDICQMPNGDIAVSSINYNNINIVRLSSSQLSLIRTIQLSENLYGITFFDGALHVTTNQNRLYRVSDNGQLDNPKQMNEQAYYLTCSKPSGQLVGSFHESNSAKTAVYRLSRDNTYTEVIKADIVKQAGGIDTDDEDNIYVCGYTSNNVLQISADGSKTTELLSSKDVSNPIAIHVCGTKMYVYENGKNVINQYELE